MQGLNTYDYGARQYDPITVTWNGMDPLCEKYRQFNPLAYCMDNPVKHVDKDGRKVYLYATSLPGVDVPFATHTFIAIKDQKNDILGYYAYGSEYDGLKGAVGGQLKQRFYKQDLDIIKGLDTEHLKKEILINPPKGVTEEEFDKKVIEVAKSFGNNIGIRYFFIPTKPTEGNCNTSSSTILLKSGISEEEANNIEKQIPGLDNGFSKYPKPWTEDEQEKAVKEEKKINEISKALHRW